MGLCFRETICSPVKILDKFSSLREITFLAGICVGPCLRETKFSSLIEMMFVVGMCVGFSSQRVYVASLVS